MTYYFNQLTSVFHAFDFCHKINTVKVAVDPQTTLRML